METVWNCPLCKSGFENHKPFERVAIKFDKPIQITYAICDNCGLVFLWDRQNDEEQEDYYMKGEYRTIVQGTPMITDRVIVEQTARAEYLLPEIDSEPKNVLDVGASTGIWLDVLRDKFNCKVLGIEPGEHFRINNPYNVKMFSEMAMLYTPEYYNSFDMITVIHVLEHMNDPVGFLVSLHEFIEPGGVLYIEVPNLFAENCLTISHPICFTVDTLTHTLHRAGWEVEWLKEYYGFKTNRTNPPNILVKAVPNNRINDIIKKPDIQQIADAFVTGQEIVMKDYAELQKEKK